MTIDILNVHSPDWMSDPARKCAIPAQYDTPETAGAFADKWFPSPIAERAAKKECRGCPLSIKTACFTYAFENPELEGVWGETTTAERHLLRAAAKKKADNDAA